MLAIFIFPRYHFDHTSSCSKPCNCSLMTTDQCKLLPHNKNLHVLTSVCSPALALTIPPNTPDKITTSLLHSYPLRSFLPFLPPPKMPCLLPMPLWLPQTPSHASKPISNAPSSRTFSWSTSTLFLLGALDW